MQTEVGRMLREKNEPLPEAPRARLLKGLARLYGVASELRDDDLREFVLELANAAARTRH
jgi:hypothetical protein